MLIFLYGQDTFRLKKKIDEIIAEYQKKYSSGLNLAKIDMEERDLADLKEKINVVSMFAEKKLIILSNVFGNAQKEKNLLDYFENKKLAGDNEVILIIKEARTIDGQKTTKQKGPSHNDGELLEFLLKNSKSQEFKALNLFQLKKWVTTRFNKEGVRINEKALMKLLNFVGDDLWQMDEEIKKLVAYQNYQADRTGEIRQIDEMIAEEDVERLVKPKISLDIFATIDSLARKDRKKTIDLLRKHVREGENILYLLSMFIYQFRNIIQVKDCLERETTEKNIAAQVKMHPYVFQKSVELARLFSLTELKKIYRMIFQVDLSIKTGRIEPETALDLLVMEITK